MIEPTPGRVVWYTPHPKHPIPGFSDMPPDGIKLAAIVAFVHNDRMVNLSVIDVRGAPHPVENVTLLQDDEQPTGEAHYCEWMPYQKGQAEGGKKK